MSNSASNIEKGLLYVYTGHGKGKTTAAVGLSVMAKSQGMSVLFAQFMKKDSGGETEMLEKLSIEVLRFTKVLSPLFNPKADKDQIRKEALDALSSLSSLMGQYEMIVLDEFSHLIGNGLITDDEASELIMGRPAGLSIVVTGRGAPQWLIDMADRAIEMKEIRHPSQKGIKARRGIEF